MITHIEESHGLVSGIRRDLEIVSGTKKRKHESYRTTESNMLSSTLGALIVHGMASFVNRIATTMWMILERFVAGAANTSAITTSRPYRLGLGEESELQDGNSHCTFMEQKPLRVRSFSYARDLFPSRFRTSPNSMLEINSLNYFTIMGSNLGVVILRGLRTQLMFYYYSSEAHLHRYPNSA